MNPEPEKLKFMQSVLLDRSKLMTLPTNTHSLVDQRESDKDKQLFQTMSTQQFHMSKAN